MISPEILCVTERPVFIEEVDCDSNLNVRVDEQKCQAEFACEGVPIGWILEARENQFGTEVEFLVHRDYWNLVFGGAPPITVEVCEDCVDGVTRWSQEKESAA